MFNIARSEKLPGDSGWRLITREMLVYQDPKTNEISLSWAPSQVLRGFSFRTSVTLQDATFTSFKISNAVSQGIIGRQSNLPDVDINGNLYGLKVINEMAEYGRVNSEYSESAVKGRLI